MPHAACYETRHARNATLPMHRHAVAYAALMLDGSHVEASLDGPRRCEPGLLVLHPRFHAHGNRFGRLGARVLNLDLPDTVLDAPRVLRVRNLREAREVFRRHPSELGLLLADATEARDTEVPLPAWQAAFVAALRERVLRQAHGERDDIARLAREFGVSAAHASRALTASHGMSPQRLRLEARLQHAIALLSGALPLATVATAAGFSDQSHFTRLCRAATGLPPAALRRRIKSVQDDACGAMVH